MDATFATIIAMLLQACEPTTPFPEPVQIPPAASDEAAPVEPDLVAPTLAKLTCALDTSEQDGNFSVVAKLVAPAVGASGNYMFGFENSGQSSISIMRSSTFELGPNEELVLAQTMTDNKGTLAANLLVDGEALVCKEL